MTTWTTPEVIEIDMSAEIGSYQDDTEPREDWTERLAPADVVDSSD
jgi:coenzyme PQQ precursor peptide PqqA